MEALFGLGNVVATPGCLKLLEECKQTVDEFIDKHVAGDYGTIDAEDAQQNAWALKAGARIMSAYKTKSGKTIWIITEADRSSTCLLLPDEY